MSTSLLDVSPVIPVVTLDDPRHAIPVARALVAGGISIIELTLRTPAGPECLTRIAQDVPEILLGAGTVVSQAQADDAVSRGAQFLVSPGSTDALLRHLIELPVPALPGVATAGEAMKAFDSGLTELKFFPAEPAGGRSYLAALAAPLPHLRFCPTGGVSEENLAAYLALSNVSCVGGSWLTPQSVVSEENWGRVSELARTARALARAVGPHSPTGG